MKFYSYIILSIIFVSCATGRKNPQPYFAHEGEATPLWHIKRLNELVFSKNKRPIPSEVKYIKIYVNNIANDPQQNLLSYLDSCPKVEQIFLIYPDGMIQSDFSKELLTQFEQMPRLNRLVMQVDSAHALPKLVSNFTSIKYLDIVANYFHEIKFDVIASDSLKQFMFFANSVGEFNIDWSLSNNLEGISLNGYGDDQVPELGALKKIINLSYTNLTCTKLSDQFFNLPTLENLNLMTPNLVELNDSISQLRSLKRLWLNKCKIKTLPKSINRLENLDLIHLETPFLTELKSFGELPNLENLYILSLALDSLPNNLGNLPRLKELQLHLSDKIKSFEPIGQIHSIEHLVLLGINPVLALDEILKLQNLEVLEVSACSIEESNMVELGRLKKSGLKHLYFLEYSLYTNDYCPDKFEILKEKLKGILPNKFLK